MAYFRLTEPAFADINEIIDYIEKDNPIAAHSVLQTIKDTAELIAGMPEMGRTCDYLSPGLRAFFIKPNYVMYYEIIPEGIEITCIVHGARDIESMF